MEQHLFVLLFFTGVVALVLSVPRKYFLIQQGKTWSDAKAYCTVTYTDLAIVETNENMVELQYEAQRQKFSSIAWIGMYNDINSWRWSFGNEPLTTGMMWLGGWPNNNGGHRECGLTSTWGWITGDCNTTGTFVCFNDTTNGNKVYIYISNKMTWYDAQAYCRTHYMDLASSRNATENSKIQNAIAVYTWTWFGLFRDSWKWTDQSKFSTISWMPGKPDNKLGNENCGYVNDTMVADASCSDIIPFFCYSGITVTKIMKVKIQSSQDVNDPAVQGAILEQIKQKLKDHGIAENITVKWREQPDGSVFNKE